MTREFLFAGPRPVEQGHLHPADIGAEETRRLIAGTARVEDAVGMDTGLVHCEWIVAGAEPYLVECAGRAAGDGIIEMIEIAWDYDLLGQYRAMMAGKPPTQAPAAPSRYTAVWTAAASAGEVVSVAGVPDAEASTGVHTCVVKRVGRPIHGLHSSWDRVAAVLAEGPTAAAALASAQTAVGLINVTIRPAAQP